MNEAQLSGLGSAIAERIKARAGELIVGAAEDLAEWAQQIAADAVEAVSLGRPDLVQALEEQVVARGEAQRLRATAAAWRALQGVVGDVLAAAAGLAGGVKP